MLKRAAAVLLGAIACLSATTLSSVSTLGRRHAPVGDDRPDLSGVIRVRLDPTTLSRLDRVVAFAQGRGRRDVTRSYLMRDALDAYLAEVEKEFPEVTKLPVT